MTLGRGHLKDLGWVYLYAESLEPGYKVEVVEGKQRVFLSDPGAHGNRVPAGTVHTAHVALTSRQPGDGCGEFLPHFAGHLIEPRGIHSRPCDAHVHGDSPVRADTATDAW